MKTLFIAFVLVGVFVSSGCVESRRPRPRAEPSLMNPYPASKAEVMKKRMLGLKVGMTLEQCRDTLGLDSRTMIGDAQESPGRLLVYLYPAEGHVIMILLDTSKKPAALLSVRVDEETWPEVNPQSPPVMK